MYRNRLHDYYMVLSVYVNKLKQKINYWLGYIFVVFFLFMKFIDYVQGTSTITKKNLIKKFIITYLHNRYRQAIIISLEHFNRYNLKFNKTTST